MLDERVVEYMHNDFVEKQPEANSFFCGKPLAKKPHFPGSTGNFSSSTILVERKFT